MTAADLRHRMTFADVEDGLAARTVHHWIDDAGDPAPGRRAPFRAPRPSEESK